MAAQKHTGDQRAAPDWDRLRVVLAMRDGGSLSAAGRLLHVDHTTIARQLRALEKDLGGALFERSATGMLATTLGEEVIAAAERMQEEVHGLLRRLDGAPSGPVGRVRLTATPYLVASLFAPSLRMFLDAHPGLQLELIGDNRSLDLLIEKRTLRCEWPIRRTLRSLRSGSAHWLLRATRQRPTTVLSTLLISSPMAMTPAADSSSSSCWTLYLVSGS
jgi:DNA-binding transcriptional LysR family regulator